MNNNINRKEKITSPENREISNKPENKIDTPGRAALDTMAPIDTAEATIGRVSEALSENRDGDLGSGGGKTGDDSATVVMDIKEIKEKLLASAPAPREMRVQIEREIKKEINYLHKKAMKMIISPSEIDYFEMNNLIKKLRELKGTLRQLVKASLDTIKTMWLRFVHGIM